MPELIIFNDLHLADKPPRGRKPGYYEEGLDMLSEVVDIARERKAEAIVGSGDLFHVKIPWRTSHRLIQQVIGILGAAPCPVFLVPGNHDMGPAGIESLHDQPLGVLHQAGVAVILQTANYSPIKRVKTPSSFHIVPREFNVHRDADPEWYALRREEQATEGPVILVAHGSITPSGVYREYPVVQTHELDMAGIDVIAAGHIHEDLGTHYSESTYKWYTNVGSLGRTARTEANMTRTVKIVSVHRDPLSVEEIPLKSALPAEEIFWDREAEVPVDDTIAEFVERLKENADFEQMDLPAAVRQLGLDPEVEASVLYYMEEAE